MTEYERPKVRVVWMSASPTLFVDMFEDTVHDVADDVAMAYQTSLRDMTIPEMTAYAARVSNPANQANTLTMPNLLGYLEKHKHWSPFQMTHICVLVERTPRAIAHQMIRHSSIAFQEFSQRYAELDADVQPIIWEARLAGAKNRQSSIETADEGIKDAWTNVQHTCWIHCYNTYKRALAVGIAPEVARSVLPEGLTPTTFFAATTLRSWIHYLEARLAPDAQKEHRILAEEIRRAFVEAEPSFEDILPSGVKAEGQ